jgi:hypothetical protein
MEGGNGFYAILQFSLVPERFEFVNVGIVLFIPARKLVIVKISRSKKRVEKVFGKQPSTFASYFQAMVSGFANRILVEFKNEVSIPMVQKFGDLRANSMRVSPVMPISISDPETDAAVLFKTLVGEDVHEIRRPRIATELREKFERAGIIGLVDEPEPIEIDETGILITAPFGYQNGHYNLIDPVRFGSNSDRSFKEASKRAIIGQMLSRSKNGKKLIVVGDFSDKLGKGFFDTVSDIIYMHSGILYRMDNLQPLLEDIRRNAASHRI